MKINMNDAVKIKLTEEGKRHLRAEHDSLKTFYPSMGDFKLRLDSDGFYKTQMWTLMNTFGHLYSMGSDLPFETEIYLVK